MEAQYCHVAWWGNGVLLMVFGLQDPRIKKAKWSVLTRTEECDGYWRDGPFIECARTFAFQWKRWWTIKIDRHLNMIELDLKKNPRYSIFSFLAKNSASNTTSIALMVLPEAGPSMTNIEMRNSTAGKSGRICWSTTVCTLYENHFCTIAKNNLLRVNFKWAILKALSI